MNKIDPVLVSTVYAWSPRSGPRPEVEIESWKEGLRVKLIYQGVETGLLFNWESKLTESLVRAELDRVYETLCWRVMPIATPIPRCE